MKKRALIWGAFLGLTAILLGAFGAHALKSILETKQLISFETAVRYQMYHALLLLILGFQNKYDLGKEINFIILGTILFSVSIYILCLNSVFQINAIQIIVYIFP